LFTLFLNFFAKNSCKRQFTLLNAENNDSIRGNIAVTDENGKADTRQQLKR